ncbi:MAG: hypothetical protein AAGI71_14785, partial [Bacteroidota bacterium]
CPHFLFASYDLLSEWCELSPSSDLEDALREELGVRWILALKELISIPRDCWTKRKVAKARA